MGKLNFVASISNKDKTKHYAFPVQINEQQNLIGAYPFCDNKIDTLFYTTSHKRAKEIAEDWNRQWKSDGRYYEFWKEN